MVWPNKSLRRTPKRNEDIGNIRLCNDCHETFTGRRYWKKEGVTGHHLHPNDFFAAVEDNCWACLSLRAQISSEQYDLLKSYSLMVDRTKPPTNHFTWLTVGNTSDPAVVGPRGSLEFHVMFGGDVGKNLQEVSRQSRWNITFPALYLSAQPLATIDRTKLSVPAGEDTFADEAWTTAEQWINDCFANHVACNQAVPFKYPTRLLEVGDSGEDTIRLIETTDTTPHGRYVTLSHRWNSEPFLTLQRYNLKEMKSGVSLSRLSRTFMDAVEVARKMNIRYVWVDSLCIIQNEPDLDDWEKESLRMGEYYSRAFCNISATASSSGSEGLRRERDHMALQHAIYNMPSLHGRLAGPYSISNVSLWSSQLDEAPLHRRAWVLQERLLAPRVLHFGDGQLLWECREQTASEMYPRGLPKIAALQSRSRFKSLDPVSPINQKRFASTDADTVARQLWHHICKEYSRCLLTYPQDKTQALAGIVELFGSILKDDYIHGLWKRDLHHALLWRTQDSMYPPSSRLYQVPHPYPLPSWSWLSSDCPLLLRDNPAGSSSLQEEKMLYQVLDILANPPALIMSCLLRHAELHLTKYGMFQVELLTKSGKFEGFRLPDVNLDGLLDDVKKPGDATSVLILPARLSTEIQHTKGDTPVVLFEGLLVKRCEEHGAYKRIGLLRVQDEAEVVDTLLAIRPGGLEVPCRRYDTVTSMYEIALV